MKISPSLQDPAQDPNGPLAAARFIKEIGRGKDGARSLSREDAQVLYVAMLDGRVSDLELGAILLAMRVKGESVEEIAGFLDAAESSFVPLTAPPGRYAPIVIPSYNGARHMVNLTPLLALLLAREGVPVLVHGVLRDAGRITSAEIFDAMDLPPISDAAGASEKFERGLPVFMAIDDLAPKLARLLAMRRTLGVRNSTHTLVKIMQPFAGPALRLTSYTHPEYFAMLTDYFLHAAPAARGDAFLMRGTEGETVANARRAQQIDWFCGGVQQELVVRQAVADEFSDALKERDSGATAGLIRSMLAGETPVPPAIVEQVRHCLIVSAQIAQRG